MKQNKLARVGALAMSVMMVGSMFATSVFAADNDPVIVDDKGVITVQDPGASGVTTEKHTYNAIRVFDKYVIQEAREAAEATYYTAEDQEVIDGTKQVGDVKTPAVTAQEAMYQYELTEKLNPDEADTVTFGAFDVDAWTGKITTNKAITIGEDTIPAGTVVTDKAPNTSALNQNTNTSLGAMFATAVAQYCIDHEIAADVEVDGGKQSAPVQQGYYVLYEKANASDPYDGLIASKPILFELGDQAMLTPKDAKVTLEKTITDEGAVDKAHKNDYEIGDTVNYQVATNFPIYEADVDGTSLKFDIVDTLSSGLTLNEAVTITVGADGTPGASDYTMSTEGNKLEIKFVPEYIIAHQGEAIKVAYSAVVNKDAVIHGTNDNDVSVEFSNNPENPSDSKKLEDKDTVYTYGIDFIKLDGTHNEKLAGAKFTLSNADGIMSLIKVADDDFDIYRPAVGTEAGAITEFETSDKEIRFIGLDAGTYTLNETAAPTGFAKLEGDLSFTITAKAQEAVADNPDTDVDESKPATGMTGNATVESGSNNLAIETAEGKDAGVLTAEYNVDAVVKNYEGISLPSTGAMTSLFVTAAGAAVVGGGLFFGLRRKKDEDED